MNKKLTRNDLWSLEEYSDQRTTFRQKILGHKQNRQISLGNHLRLCFEDMLTIKYQIQEMLRIEKIFDANGIQEELDAYNPLIPDGKNWKATLMIEYEDAAERKERLGDLIGVENTIWIQINDFDIVYPICDEDLDRANDTKTSAVHFLRYELTHDMIKAAKQTKEVFLGVSHSNLSIPKTKLRTEIQEALAEDLVLL